MKRGTNPNSLANLRPYKPGHKGGRPKKGDCIIEIARNLLPLKVEMLDGKKYDMTWETLVARTWLERCLVSDKALSEMLERFYGRVPLPVVGAGGGPLELIVRYDGNKVDTGSAIPQ